MKKNIKTISLVEICNVGTCVLWYYLILYATAGLIFQFLLYFIAPYLIVRAQFYQKSRTSEWQVLAVFLIAFVGALLASMFLTSALFNAAGIPNYVAFNF